MPKEVEEKLRREGYGEKAVYKIMNSRGLLHNKNEGHSEKHKKIVDKAMKGRKK